MKHSVDRETSFLVISSATTRYFCTAVCPLFQCFPQQFAAGLFTMIICRFMWWENLVQSCYLLQCLSSYCSRYILVQLKALASSRLSDQRHLLHVVGCMRITTVLMGTLRSIIAAVCCNPVQLKGQHVDRPIWVLPDGHIYLEASSPYYHQVKKATSTVLYHGICLLIRAGRARQFSRCLEVVLFRECHVKDFCQFDVTAVNSLGRQKNIGV